MGSPGIHLSEAEFINAISGGEGPDDVSYRLPEFVTSFLLTKDVELEIISKSNKLYQAFVGSSITSSSSDSQQKFFVAYSMSSSSQSREFGGATTKVHKTSTGMKIKIPGAQVIGYYTQKLPKFPSST